MALRNVFQSTPSLRKVTCNLLTFRTSIFISIHTFLTEGDCCTLFLIRNIRISIHTFLTEGDCIAFINSSCCILFQSTPSLRKVTLYCSFAFPFLQISIHTFLTEGDRKNIYNYFFIMHIFMHYILSYL